MLGPVSKLSVPNGFSGVMGCHKFPGRRGHLRGTVCITRLVSFCKQWQEGLGLSSLTRKSLETGIREMSSLLSSENFSLNLPPDKAKPFQKKQGNSAVLNILFQFYNTLIYANKSACLRLGFSCFFFVVVNIQVNTLY